MEDMKGETRDGEGGGGGEEYYERIEGMEGGGRASVN